MAAVEGLERGYLGTLMRLTLLSPAMVEAILNWWLLDWVPVRLGGSLPSPKSHGMGSGLIYKCVRLGENNTLALWLPDGPVGRGVRIPGRSSFSLGLR